MPLNVLIPMGGLGSRFSKEGYRFPKPLVNIVGRPMLFWLLDHLTGLTKNDIVWVAVSASIDSQFGLVQRLKTEYPHLTIKAVLLTFDTRGAAETLFTVLQSMTPQELQHKTISLDCDTIYFDPILERFKALEEGQNASFYFEDNGGKAIFSYVALDHSDKIVDVREKVMISTHANTGAYAFASGRVLHQYCAKILNEAVGSVGEYYTTHIIHQMLVDGHYFAGLRVHQNGFTCVGTPTQLQDLLRKLKLMEPSDAKGIANPLANGTTDTNGDHSDVSKTHGRPSAIDTAASSNHNHPLPRAKRRMRFCFDLDNTLVTYPQIAKDYSSVLPIEKNIQLVRELHAAGHHIIIQTARRMKTHKGNVGAVIADVGHITLDTLARFNIPYDEILFGKPYADVYVDDLAVHALVDTAKEIGWQLGDASAAEEAAKPIKGFVAARHFNTLQEMDNIIVKTAATLSIAGEVYFYQHIPDDISHLFPKLQRVEQNDVMQALASPNSFTTAVDNKAQSVSSLFIEKIAGVTYSHLYVNRALTGGRLEKLLGALLQIHSSNGTAASVEPSELIPSDLIYDNYSTKMSKRYEIHADLYQLLEKNSTAVNVDSIHEILYDWFLEYARSDRGIHSKAIHGDPVFSNALLTAQGTVRLIDMRGRLGEILTIEGDAVYDLAKVFQSIDGYDFILHDIPMTETDTKHANELKQVFAAFVVAHYPKVRLSDVFAVTALLYFSLIPLHNNVHHQVQFLRRAARLAENARDQARTEAKSRGSRSNSVTTTIHVG